MTHAVRHLLQQFRRKGDDRRNNGDQERRAQFLRELPRAVRLGRPEFDAHRAVAALDALEPPPDP